MAFVQPWMLWVLPAIFLPLIIHLLNRLRYKTVHWAAMMFLLKANRAATRRAKIRQYLLLACRMLLLLFFIWAMARPLVGGWIGAAAGGAPEAVVILLDRSASMEDTGADRQESKRAHALSLLSQAANQSEGSRFVLIESALREPLEIANASALANMAAAGPSDTAADMPAMFRAALDYLSRNRPGSAEIWVASDMQASNWRSESPEWPDISARFAGLPHETRVRVLELSAESTRNASVTLQSAELRTKDGKGQLVLITEVKSQGAKGPLPVFVTRDGVKSQTDLPLTSATQRQSLKFDVPKVDAAAGWGKVELPADDQGSDNTAWFVYAPPLPVSTSIISDHPSAVRLKLAAAPDKSRTDRKAEILPPGRADSIPWKETALVLWQAPAPTEAVAKSVQAFVESGGALVCYPPGTEGAGGMLGLSWGAAENSPPDAPFSVATWDDLDGPLAKTDSGAPLAVARMELLRRQIPALNDPATHVYATFADGRPFLLGKRVGSGHLFACAALPSPDWGNLGEGLVLLPMTQRQLALGSRRLAPPVMATVGEWSPPDPEESWTSVDASTGGDWHWKAGVYQSGTKKIALNRPQVEDAADVTDSKRLPEMLKNVKLDVLTGALDLKADRLQSEIWPLLVVIAMLAMCAEMLLATSKGLLPVRPTLQQRSPLHGDSPLPDPSAS